MAASRVEWPGRMMTSSSRDLRAMCDWMITFWKNFRFYVFFKIVIWWIFLHRNLFWLLRQNYSSTNSAYMFSKVRHKFLYWFWRDCSPNTNAFRERRKVFVFRLRSRKNQYKNLYPTLENIYAELVGEQICSNSQGRLLYRKIRQITILKKT